MTRYSLLLVVAAVLQTSWSTPCYDHQTTTYKAQFQPTACNKECTVTPFFSPDHSVTAYVEVIKDAQTSIDLMEPDFKSWSTCTHYSSECGGKCIGCTLEDQYNEPFPIFPAILNTMHSVENLKVRFLSNDFKVPTCSNLTTPLDWFAINGVQIKHYKSTTFQHAKFMIIDGGRKILISSVNFSKTSFTKNREAGVILENCDCPLTKFYQQVFDSDFEEGYDYQVANKYTKDEIKYMTHPSLMPMPGMGPFPVTGAFVTEMIPVEDATVVKGYTSPDYARDTFMEGLDSAKKSLMIHIYQVTDDEICNKILELFNKGVNVTMIVGSYIVSYVDYHRAQLCYQKLYNGGMKPGMIQKSYSKFSFSHQKYWIVDGTTVHLSTGNWSPSDFPEGSTFPPYKTSKASVNRDMLVVMESPKIVEIFSQVFQNDWIAGTPWQPK